MAPFHGNRWTIAWAVQPNSESHTGSKKIYFYLTAEELNNLKVGDVLNDGEDFTIVEIDKDDPCHFFIDYDEKDFV